MSGYKASFRFCPILLIMIITMLPFRVPAVFAEAKTLASNLGSGKLEALKVLDLKTAQEIALAENPSFAAVSSRIVQAQAQLVQARSAYFPRLDVSATAARVTQSESDFQSSLAAAASFGPSAVIKDPEDYYSADLTASWILFNGFERHYAHAAARFGLQSSRSAFRDAERLLLSAVSTAYYAAQLAIENIAIAEADEAFNKRQLMEAKARRRVGTGSLSDELNFEVRVNAAKAQVIQAQQIYDRAMFSLAALLGVPNAVFPANLSLAALDPETAIEMTVPLIAPLIDLSQSQRPDILRARQARRQADSLVKIARAKFFPVLRFIGSIEGDRVGDSEFDDDDFGNTIAASLSYPLFTGGLNRAKFRQAKAQADEAENELENLILTVKANVRSAATKVISAQSQLKIQRENAALVQRNRDLVEKEYMAGQGSLVRLNQAQRDLITAQGRLALALVSLRQAWDDLRTETGEILQ